MKETYKSIHQTHTRTQTIYYISIHFPVKIGPCRVADLHANISVDQQVSNCISSLHYNTAIPVLFISHLQHKRSVIHATIFTLLGYENYENINFRT